MYPVRVVDSHTAGEPTRVIVEGGPDLGLGSMTERLARFRREFDHIRSGVTNEPRGSDVLVGALLCEPVDQCCVAGVIFFNNIGYLGMCGHGTIGLVTTLRYLGRLAEGMHRIETPVGVVTVQLHTDGRVSVQNVPSYRYHKDVTLDVPDYGIVKGDVAWGGNWFFLVKGTQESLSRERIPWLMQLTLQIRDALSHAGVTGANGAVIDHVELFGPPSSPLADSRSFVLCPGGAYDRSPCGTGTSAKLACLAADGEFSAGRVWRQESILGTIFEGTISEDHDLQKAPTSDYESARYLPTITGTAWVTADGQLIFDPTDPFVAGIRS